MELQMQSVENSKRARLKNLQQYCKFDEAEANLGRFIEDVYNAKRLHSSLGYRPPDELETSHGVAGRT